MRGKRPEDYEQQYDNYSSNDDDLRLYQALMSGTDSLSRWYEDQLNGLDPSNDDFGYEKRAPAGFVGMRGRRFYDSDLISGVEARKRAPSGFTAMRGKRAPSGFMGKKIFKTLKFFLIFFLVFRNARQERRNRYPRELRPKTRPSSRLFGHARQKRALGKSI